MRWGLIPSWVKNPKSARKLINARAETLDEKPSFRGLLAHKRCLVPADGFYEWKQLEGKAKKQLYRFQRRDARPFCFAGLWDLWQGMGGKAVYTFTVITTTANGLVDQVHARMPALLDEATQLRWIASGALSPMERRTLLQPYPAERLQMMALPELPHDRPEG
jgi:putative SOS response-associated peptidase YedK